MLRINNRKRGLAVRCSLLLAAALTTQGFSLSIPIPAAAAETDEQTEDGEQSSRIRQEKEYFREALDELEDMGLSPIRIWSEITGNTDVMEGVDSLRDSVTEAVTEKVGDAQDAAAQAVNEAVQKETEKVKKGLIQMIQEQIRSFLDGIFH